MFKEKWSGADGLSRAMGRLFARLPLPPNFYTLTTLVLAGGGLMAIAAHRIYLGIAIFVASGVIDIIDGGVARESGRTSALGAFIDGTADRFVDLCLVYSYFWIPIDGVLVAPEKWICLQCFFMIMPSFVVAYANHRGAVPDPTERVIWRILHRAEMFVLMLLVPLVAASSPRWAGYALALVVGLSALTTLQTILLALVRARQGVK